MNSTQKFVPYQVAFGTDFSKDPFTQKVAGSGGLQPVLENSLAGVLELFTNPFAKVGQNI